VLKRGAGHLSVQSGDILYASQSDVEILLNRDGNDVVSQSESTYGAHDDTAHEQVRYKRLLITIFVLFLAIHLVVKHSVQCCY